MRLQKLNPVTDTAYDELFLELVGLDGELRRLGHGESVVDLRGVDGLAGTVTAPNVLVHSVRPWLTS